MKILIFTKSKSFWENIIIINRMEIKVEYDGRELQLSTYGDSDLDDWKDVFKTILIWATFHEDLIKEMFPEPEE